MADRLLWHVHEITGRVNAAVASSAKWPTTGSAWDPAGVRFAGPANHPDLLGRRDKLYISDVSYFLGFKDQGSFGGAGPNGGGR